MILRIIFLLIIFNSPLLINAQNTNWFVETDSIPNCSILNKNQFIHMLKEEKPSIGYRIEFQDDYVTEYYENGRYIVKSAIKYTSNCEYTTTVIKVTIPNYPLTEGTQIHSEILKTNTKEGLVLISSKLKRKTNKLILRKVD
ncbi:hypothetical protein [Marinigracilibium pacificum]|uniref:Uncharacterized protein n=1 Tax=Marinigracilibium pacificum TaxID=2729599 RepID=A0A848J318_9BACT|nr:hypothetical protein [Marinigracilibium pacificum]NMM50121.1 hypothetical protein [Marinigracilibium pacificum]